MPTSSKVLSTALASLAVVLFAFPVPFTSAASMHTTGALAQGAVWAQDAQFNNSVWVRTTKGGVDRYASGIAIDPWNVLVTGHQLYEISDGGFATSVTVGTGSNYLTDPGLTFDLTADDYLIHPNWNGTVFSQQIDIGMLFIEEGIPGMAGIFDFGSVSLGERLPSVGFGQPATGGGGYLPVDGKQRAAYQFVDGFGSSGGSVSQNYIRNIFSPTFIRNEPMAGGLTVGDSGAAVFDEDGNLVGMGVGGSGTVPLYGYSSYSLRLGLFETWVNDNRIIPEPGSLFLLGFGAIFMIRRR